MKKTLFLLGSLFIFLTTYAQTFKVEKFEEILGSSDAIDTPKYDINQEIGGLIHIDVNAKNLSFGGNVIETIETTDGYDLYVLDGTTGIKIQHPSLRIFRLKTSQYGIANLKAGKTYSLVLSLDENLSNRVEYKSNPDEIQTDINNQILLINNVRYFNVLHQQLNGYDSNGRRATIPKFIIQCEVSLWNDSVIRKEIWKAKSYFGLKTNQIAIINSNTGKSEVLSDQEFQNKIKNGLTSLHGIFYIIGDKSNKYLQRVSDLNFLNSWELTINVPYDKRFFQHREYKPMNITYKIVALDLSSDFNKGEKRTDSQLNKKDEVNGTASVMETNHQSLKNQNSLSNQGYSRLNIVNADNETEDRIRQAREEINNVKDEIFVAVEKPGEFPGGQAELMKWLSQNIRYPETAQQNEVQGRVVVKLVIEKDGSISNAEIARGVDKDLDQEAIRVVMSMPKWTPAQNNGMSVRSYFNLPVTFKLNN